MNAQLLIIDPQNDFCDIPGAALGVPGATADLQRVTDFISRTQSTLSGITVTLDSHPGVAIERTSFWENGDGEPVEPFTFVTADAVRAGQFMPRNRDTLKQALYTLDQLAATDRKGLVVWPVHCVVGTPGHNIYPVLAQRLLAWEINRQVAVRRVFKGEHPMTEHFGVFEADVPLANALDTQFNTALAHALTSKLDILFIAGEASSHCVASSYSQLASYRAARSSNSIPQVVILTDCMSPVPGFEANAQAFFDAARKDGCLLMTADEASDYLVRA